MIFGGRGWGRRGVPLTALPVELADGINKVVQPVAGLWMETRSGWWIADSLSAPAECSCRAEIRAFWKPSNSSTVRFSRRDRIWSSVRTVSVIVAVTAEIKGMLSVTFQMKLILCKTDAMCYT